MITYEFEDVFRESVVALREFASREQLSYDHYAQLKSLGRQALREEMESITTAVRGTLGIFKEDDWLKLYHQLLDLKHKNKITEPVSND